MESTPDAPPPPPQKSSRVPAHKNGKEDRADRKRDGRSSLSPDPKRSGSSTGMGERKNSKIMGQSAPILYENALVGDWTSLVARAYSHPSEVEYTDRRCNTPLHLACRRQPPPEVIKALLKADPMGACRVTVDGMMPVHFAAYCGAEAEVVRLLLEAAAPSITGSFPSTNAISASNGKSRNPVQKPRPPENLPLSQSTQVLSLPSSVACGSPLDRRGRTPLHLAMSGFRTTYRPNVVALLLRSDPSSATRPDERERTPLGLLYDDFAEEVEDALSEGCTAEEVKGMCLNENGDLRECWVLLNMLLRAAYHGTVSTTGKSLGSSLAGKSSGSSGGVEVDVLNGPYRPLHAAAGVYETPSKFVRLILLVHPQSAKEQDDDFNLPLHIAARATARRHRDRKGRATALRSVSLIGAGVVMQGNAAKVGAGSGIGSAGNNGVYNDDFGRSTFTLLYNWDGHNSAQHGASGFAVTRKKPVSALGSEPHTAIDDLMRAFPGAASVMDESGRYPLILAIESGKLWETGIKPILDAYPQGLDNKDMLSVVQNALVAALTSPVREVREETGRTVRGMVGRWHCTNQMDVWKKDYLNGEKVTRSKIACPADLFISDSVRLSGRSNNSQACQGSEISSNTHGISVHGVSTADEWVGIQSSALEALAGVYANISLDAITLPERAKAGLTVGTHMLRHEDETVRENAAKVVGSAVELLGPDSAKESLQDLLNDHRPPPPDRPLVRRGSRRFSGGSRSGLLVEGEKTDDESDFDDTDLAKHGRAAACFRILSSPAGEAVLRVEPSMLRKCTLMTQDLMLDKDVAVRRSACITIGALLNVSPDPIDTLREVRRTVQKCMRVAEDESVHISLARGLILARKCKHDVFLCKAGMPLLDGALVLAVSSAICPHVQQAFHGFLWLALGVGAGEGAGLEKYMNLAEGENGMIMMTLVTKTLSKIEHVEEDQY